jgi:hypothetical protein
VTGPVVSVPVRRLQAADRLIGVPLIEVLAAEQIPVMDNDMFGTGTLGADERRRVVSRSRKELPVAHPLRWR